MSHQNPPLIRVLVVEDSPVARELLVNIVQSAPGMQVVGVARNGAEGVRLAHRLKPDIITMDAHMPEMDGFEATRQIMAEIPRPIVMITASMDKYERDMSFDALKAGALSVLEKPTMYDPPEAFEFLINKLRLMAEVKVLRRWDTTRSPNSAIGTKPLSPPPAMVRNGHTKIQLVAIASSTGGPGALAQILAQLPADFAVPVIIVQHITPGFGESLAQWLNQQTPLAVRLARQADVMQPGQVLIAPDDHHLTLNSLGMVSLNKEPPLHGVRPSADYLFQSVAQVFGATAIGVILTGMGSDGAEGLRQLRGTGAHTIAQNEQTCVVFGMPAVAIKLGAAEQILPIQQVTPALLSLVVG